MTGLKWFRLVMLKRKNKYFVNLQVPFLLTLFSFAIQDHTTEFLCNHQMLSNVRGRESRRGPGSYPVQNERHTLSEDFHSLAMYFQRLSLSQIADFEVHESGNVDQKDYVKAPLFLFTKICPRLYLTKPNSSCCLNASSIPSLVIQLRMPKSFLSLPSIL